MTSIFSRVQLREPKEIEDVPYMPCSVHLCDGSGLREVEATWFGGMRLVRCECRKNLEVK